VEHAKWRRSEWISIGSIAIIATWIWVASAKSHKWDEIVVKVEDHNNGIDALNARITRIEDQNKEELSWMRGIAKAVGARRQQVDQE